MASLIVHAHPVPDSLSRALFDTCIAALETHGGSVVSASLCDGDDPNADELRKADTLVFVHPTWWGGPPAILLDWIERRVGPWIDGSPTDPSPLASVHHLAVVTTHGSPRMLNRITGEPGRRLFEDSVRPLCAPDCAWHWIAYYGIDADDPESRKAFEASVPGRLANLSAP